MPKYSNPLPPRLAAAIFRGEPGNYIVYDRHGGAYAGRQGPGGDRIGARVREQGQHIVAVQFMRDSQDNGCARASREQTAVLRLIDEGFAVRNRVFPDMPKRCCKR